jgi:hypothetical protein
MFEFISSRFGFFLFGAICGGGLMLLVCISMP